MLLFLHSFRNLILVVDFANGAHRGTHQLHVLSLIIIPVIYVLVSKLLKKDQHNEEKRRKELTTEPVAADPRSLN